MWGLDAVAHRSTLTDMGNSAPVDILICRKVLENMLLHPKEFQMVLVDSIPSLQFMLQTDLLRPLIISGGSQPSHASDTRQ
jgi:hypothetical protein